MNVNLVRDEKVYFNTYTSMVRLIENSYHRQCTHKHYSDPLHPIDICKVNVSSARGTGHTEAILKVANRMFDKSLILVRKRVEKDRVKHIIANKYPAQSYHKFEVESINSLDHLRGYTYENKLEAVFVDQASETNQAERMQIYQDFTPILARQPYYFFIFVG